jgi:hypothetical protein
MMNLWETEYHLLATGSGSGDRAIYEELLYEKLCDLKTSIKWFSAVEKGGKFHQFKDIHLL